MYSKLYSPTSLSLDLILQSPTLKNFHIYLKVIYIFKSLTSYIIKSDLIQFLIYAIYFDLIRVLLYAIESDPIALLY